ncbi:anti-sigma factor [Chitinophaga vietnamensis]|uniref:anti-sigma factor n=1 Tax=Chitinophaga vietnamensis TaxID=2593957 RepID=UPI001177B219|nr:anti-sigma factor [Chitinophaga vietnamensis]
MDVNRYISSGILESYVFGLLPEEENGEVESIALHYPEVQAAVNALQHDKERFVKLYSTTPPTAIKDRLMDIIRYESTAEGNGKLPEELRIADTVPAAPVMLKTTPAATNGHSKPINHIKKNAGTDRVWKYLAAAFIALLIGSVIMNFFFFQKSTDYKSRYQSLIAAREKLSEEQKEQADHSHSTSLHEEEDILTLEKDTSFIHVNMKGSGPFAGHAVNVSWNPHTHVVYLIAKLLPVPPPGKQFQLWAIVNKKMIDAGIFESGAAVSGKIQLMKAVDVADAFAVTLEKKRR